MKVIKKFLFKRFPRNIERKLLKHRMKLIKKKYDQGFISLFEKTQISSIDALIGMIEESLWAPVFERIENEQKDFNSRSDIILQEVNDLIRAFDEKQNR